MVKHRGVTVDVYGMYGHLNGRGNWAFKQGSGFILKKNLIKKYILEDRYGGVHSDVKAYLLPWEYLM